MQNILAAAQLDPLARMLPITSFLLVPIQRLARFVLRFYRVA
jgi:hypothetical protein